MQLTRLSAPRSAFAVWRGEAGDPVGAATLSKPCAPIACGCSGPTTPHLAHSATTSPGGAARPAIGPATTRTGWPPATYRPC